MGKDPAVYWYYRDFEHGTRHMNFAQKGLYITLLDEQCDSLSGSILPEVFENICNTYVNTYDEHTKNIVTEKFDTDEFGYFNKRMREVIKKRRKYCQSRSNNRKGSNNDNNICNTYDSHMANANANANKDQLNGIEQNPNSFQEIKQKFLTDTEIHLAVQRQAKIKLPENIIKSINAFFEMLEDTNDIYKDEMEIRKHMIYWVKVQVEKHREQLRKEGKPESNVYPGRIRIKKSEEKPIINNKIGKK